MHLVFRQPQCSWLCATVFEQWQWCRLQRMISLASQPSPNKQASWPFRRSSTDPTVWGRLASSDAAGVTDGQTEDIFQMEFMRRSAVFVWTRALMAVGRPNQHRIPLGRNLSSTSVRRWPMRTFTAFWHSSVLTLSKAAACQVRGHGHRTDCGGCCALPRGCPWRPRTCWRASWESASPRRFSAARRRPGPSPSRFK